MATKSKSRSRASKESPDANELLVMELQEIHSAESQLARALPRFSKAVESEGLRRMLDERLEEGERILKELDSAFDELEESPGRRRNVAAEGLIADLREHAQELARGPALDAVLTAGMQKTEHYCIAAWGTAKALGSSLDEETVASCMDRALQEGKSFDQQLTDLAEKELNPALMSMEESEEETAESEEEEQTGNGRPRGRGGRQGSERRTHT